MLLKQNYSTDIFFTLNASREPSSYLLPPNHYLESFFCRLNLLGIGSYYHNRILRWAGHVARMPISRAPQQLLVSRCLMADGPLDSIWP